MENTPLNIAQEKKITFRGLSITYTHIESTEQTISEIFNDLPYQFSSIKKNPFIIDAGSNIGIATLFFKTLYEDSKIICFEPDPNAFQLLKANIINNKVRGAQLINAALSKKAGTTDFFGQIFVDEPDARGNSIIDAWGLQRTVSNTTKVTSAKLSSYIHREVDFLKLDIEGAEQQVLEDLEKTDKLKFIHKMSIEVHQAESIKHINDINSILSLLKRNWFEINLVEKNISNLLPEETANWAKKIKPCFFIIQATRL